MMMGKLDNWILRLVPVYVLWLFVFLKSASASEDFVSIACCADSNYTDPVTKINYTSDYSWFSDRTSCRNISNRKVNHTEYDKAREFELGEGKRCYSLPTIKGEVYLLRGIFPVDNTLRETAYSLFGVLIGVSEVGSLRSFQDGEIEGVFRATKTYIDFCLVKEDGNPFVSQIELRSLDEEYLQVLNPSISKLISRVNLGSTEDDIRYPDDPSDRIWKANSSTSAVPISFSVNISNHNANMMPPLKVLQTAITHPDRLEFIKNDLDKGSAMYHVFLYFLELNGTFRSGQRVFDIYVNGEIKEKSFDILAGGSNYRYTVLNTSANGSVNITLIKASSSEFGPLCNAYEIMQLRPWMEETNQTDLEVILKVKAELLVQNQGNKVLESWSGDPCLPSPWQGVGCDYPLSSAPIISNLDLSSSDLKGPIPPSVTQLANLKILNLSHNKFNGDIPSFPSSSLLISIDLSNNELMGSLPESITDLSHLKSLYFGCNKDMSKTAPANLNSSVNTDHGRCKCKESRIQKHIIIGTVTGGSILIILAVGILVLCRYRGKLTPWGGFSKNKYPMTTNLIYSLPSKDDFFVKSVSIQAFTLQYIEAATERYKTLIGEGGFGSVYRGILEDGQEVAVKVRSATSTQGTREFENELNLLTAIRHENLVPLLGYCCENDQQILVYPFMSNGSLQDRLYGEAAKRKVLDWPTRLSIALGAAQGLLYLHTFDGRSVIHRDVKSSNILMDHSMCAKVADFGFSKYAPQEGDSNASLEVRGTAGYMDPEYYTTQQLSAKSDVFSFGVVLLEIVSGREPLNIHRPRNEWSLVEWAKPYVRASKIDEIVDPGIKGGYHAEAMWRVVESALSCVEPISANRPSMADIVRELEDALIIENNASEYMKSIESQGSNRYSFVLDKRVLPPTPSPTESTITTQTLSLPQPR